MKGNLLAIWSGEAQLCLKSLQGNIGTAKFPGERRSWGAVGRASSQCLGCSLPPASPAATAASPRDAPRQERGQSPLGHVWEFSEQLRKATVCTANQFGALSGLTTAHWGLNSPTSTSLAANSSWGEPQPKESGGEGGRLSCAPQRWWWEAPGASAGCYGLGCGNPAEQRLCTAHTDPWHWVLALA